MRKVMSKGALRLLAVCAAEDSSRFQMHSVCFTAEGEAVSTDGKRMMVLPAPEADVDEWPSDVLEASSVPEPGNGTSCSDAIVPLATIKAAIKAAGRNKLREAFDNRALIQATDHTVTVSALDGDLAVSRHDGRLVEGQYPEFKRAMPAGPVSVRFSLNPKYLQQIMAAAVQAGHDTLSFEITDSAVDGKPAKDGAKIVRAAVRIVGREYNGAGTPVPAFTAIVMPLVSDDEK